MASRDAQSPPGQVKPPASCCTLPGATTPCCIGQWEGPYQPPISCMVLDVPGCDACSGDEIAHAALIPPGAWPLGITPGGQSTNIAGMVLCWTRCDELPGYTTFVWDPANPDTVAFQPPIKDKINDATQEDGPFCAGHTWILGDDREPKLLVVGGQDRLPHEDQDPVTPGVQGTCEGVGHPICGLHRAYWFDPSATTPQNAWSDGPPDVGDSRWYPSVVTYFEPGSGFVPLVVGGSPLRVPGCGLTAGVEHQFPNWWSWSRPLLASPWTSHTSSYLWHYYPRPLLLSDDTILTVGHALICEDTTDGPPPLDNPFGGNPVSIIHPLSQTRVPGPNLNPDDTDLASATVGAWHYCNAVILHTLNSFVYTEMDPVSRYDLDRVIVAGGTRDDVNSSPGLRDPQPFTHEFHQGGFLVKASLSSPRIFSNLTILPDGTLFLEGGVDRAAEVNPGRYYATTARFDPQGPLDLGSWTTMAPRPSAGFSPPNDPMGDAIGRGYHHVALLLQDGRVAVLGGARPAVPPWNDAAYDPSSMIEVYKPPYTFQSDRLRITGTQAADMHYGTPYFFTVNDPTRIDYAALIGIGSVTHHFDYGQRYVQLMTTQANGAGNVKALAPPLETMAPEGMYLLFAVELRGSPPVPVPSKGVFVKLTF